MQANAGTLASASIFTEVDETGNVTYTNISPTANIPEEPKNSVSTQNSTLSTPPASKVKTSSNSIYKISTEVQAKRDDKRRTILFSELEQEQQALIVSQSKNDVVDADSHVRNIALLKKELGLPN